MPPQRSAGTGPEAEQSQYAGQYRLEERLGSGGMGVVHLARSASGLRLAVKVVHPEFAQDPEFRGRFRQEVGAARKVSGAFTAPVVDAAPDAQSPWMATLFIPGPTLAEHVKRNGALEPAQLRQLMAGLTEALCDIHRAGVVHRDLKPSNVLLAADGPKVIDFGISRPSDSELRTETGKLIGTPPFMAPEQFRSPREVGPAADVFALGSVIVHAATGRGPFDSDSPYLVAYQVVHDEPDLTGLPEELGSLVARCLAKEPDDRPTAGELMAELRTMSASYDTHAFIPEQRHSGDGERALGAVSAAGARTRSTGREPRPAPDDEQGNGPAAGAKTRLESAEARPRRFLGSAEARPRRHKRRWIAAALATTAALASGAVLTVALSDSPAHDSRGKTTAGPGQRTAGSTPWETALKTRTGARASGLPECTYALDKLFCGQPGVMAAAIEPSDGRVLWSRGVKAGSVDAIPSWTPVVAGGLLHVASADGKRLAALDPKTGRTRWSRDVARYRGLVAHTGEQVLLTGPDSTVTALDATTGDELWSHTIAGQAQPVFSAHGDGLAYAVSPSGAGTAVSAVVPQTGDVRWHHRFEGALTLAGSRNGVVWLLSFNTDNSVDAVIRYDTMSRSTRRIPLDFPLPGAQAVVRGDTVYLVADGGSVVAVGTGSGRTGQLWRLETSVSRASSPVAVDRRLYFTAADGRLYAVDTVRGALLGQTDPRIKGDRGVRIGSLPPPVAGDDQVYAAAPDGSLFAVNSRDPSGW